MSRLGFRFAETADLERRRNIGIASIHLFAFLKADRGRLIGALSEKKNRLLHGHKVLTKEMKMKDPKMLPNQIRLNVASSTCMQEGFVNLDNHILLRLLKMPRVIKRLLSPGHRTMLEDYERLIRKHSFIRHNCKEPLPFGADTVDHILCSHFLEHVFPSDAERIISDFRRVLKPDGTMHIILPDLLAMARKYIQSAGVANPLAADELLRESLLSRKNAGSVKYRLLELLGGYGLQHRWMYDKYSISEKVIGLGFALMEENETPSKMFRFNDGSVHVIARKS